MTPSKPDHAMPLSATRLANVPLFCCLAAIALGGVCYCLYGNGPRLYRDIRGIPDYRTAARVEDGCLWLAATAATIGINTSVVGLVVIRRSAGRFRGAYRLSLGMALNLLALLAVLFTFWVRGLLSGPNAV
jgi:hypothetical protein